jgi:DNA-binding MarR family transcriptional regulator
MVSEMLEAMADALEAAAAVLRRRAATGHPGVSEARDTRPLAERARQIHRRLGERQEQMLPLLATAGEHGATSGDIARALNYDQANATITLNMMVKAGLLLKDESKVPYRFRLVPELLT